MKIMRYQPPIHLTVSSILMLLSMLVTPPAQAQEAYFSVEGELFDDDNSFEQVPFNIVFNRDVTTTGAGAENVSFRTWNGSGGTNAADDFIFSNNLDCRLTIDIGNDSFFNVDGGTGIDAWLTNAGIAARGEALPDTIPTGSYSLIHTVENEEDLGDVIFETIAVDLVGPADAMKLGGFGGPSDRNNIDSVKFGTTGIGDDAATWEVSTVEEVFSSIVVAETGNAALEITGAGRLSLEGSGPSQGISQLTVNIGGTTDVVDGGGLEVDGTTTVLGTLTVDETSTFNANGDITVDGGTFVDNNVGSLLAANGTNLLATNDGQVETSAIVTGIFGGQTATINDGADWTHTGQLSVGVGNGGGTITVDGTESTLNVNGLLDVSSSGNRGVVNVRNNAQATSDILAVGRVFNNDTADAELNINTGGGLTVNGFVAVGDLDGSEGMGTINLDGSGSTLTQTGANAFVVGNFDTDGNDGVHALNVTNGAVLTTGTGRTTIRNTGTLTVDETSTFNARGDITVDGGTLVNENAGATILSSGRTLLATNGGQVETIGVNFFVFQGQTATIGSGSTWTHNGTLNAGLNGGDADGTITVEGNGSILNVSEGLDINNGVGNLQNNAQVVSDFLAVGRDSVNGSNIAEFNINGGGELTTGDVLVGLSDGDQGTGTINLDGSDSTITQTGAKVLLLGNADTFGNGGVHAINVTDNAVFTTGTGLTDIRQTGTLSVSTGGDFNMLGNFATTGTVDYELESSSSFEGIEVAGTATLEGVLSVGTSASFPPVLGQTFVLLEADGGINGQFENVTFSGVPDGLQYEIVYSDNTVELAVVASGLVGDFDGDEDVDADDIDFFRGNLEEPASGNLAQLDLNGSAIIDEEDLRIYVETLVQTSNGQTGTFFGDANLDGTVNVLGDAFILVGNLGGSGGWADGDFNQDGDINVLGDAFLLINNLGRSNGQ